MAQMLIANRLGDGLVVFRTADGSWVESIDAGLVIDDADEARRLLEQSLADERDNKVIDPNLIAVTDAGDKRRPIAIREAIRASSMNISASSGCLWARCGCMTLTAISFSKPAAPTCRAR